LGDFVRDNYRENCLLKSILRHYDEAVRAFVVKRIQAWSQTTQIAVYMHTEDIAFQQRQYFSFINFYKTTKFV